MRASHETEIQHAAAADGQSASRSRRAGCRHEAIELAWPSTQAARERLFHDWESSAMRCLRGLDSDFAAIIGLRKALRPDGLITVTNSELAVAAGCSARTLEIDLTRLRRAGLITSVFRSMKGVRGRIRVIRLSMPAPDGAGGRL
jgi:hypothetical protein